MSKLVIMLRILAYARGCVGRGSICPPNTQLLAIAGSTQASQCTPVPGYCGLPGTTPSKCTAPCPKDQYRVGFCGGSGHWASNYACKPCPKYSSTLPSGGAVGIEQCVCSPGLFQARSTDPSHGAIACKPCQVACPSGQRLAGSCASTSDNTCAPCRDRASCPANTHLVGTCGGTSGRADYSCAACPPRSTSPAGATEASQCTCAANYYDSDTAALGVSCSECRASCGAGEFVSAECGAVDAAHGQDATCKQCPRHSTLRTEPDTTHRNLFGSAGRQPPLIQDCKCDTGYYDQAPALSQVSCTKIPPVFGAGADKTAKCKWYKFGTGRKQQIELDLSPSNTQQLGAMVQFMKNVNTDLLYSADFNLACGTMMLQYSALRGAEGSICSKDFALFGKTGNNASHVNFLGKATLQCHGYNDLFVLGKVCLEPCIHDKSQGGCCWVPPVIAHLFRCCAEYDCCYDTSAPTPAPTVMAIAPPTSTCKDQYPTCVSLKAELDATNGSCYTTDVGEAVGEPKYNGMHLADKCCASCQPGCAACIANGHPRSFCDSIHACRESTTCSLPKDCTACMAQDTQVKCESYGVDCTETCVQTSTHRRAQGGATAAVQVRRGESSGAKLTKMLDCLAEGQDAATCIAKA